MKEIKEILIGGNMQEIDIDKAIRVYKRYLAVEAKMPSTRWLCDNCEFLSPKEKEQKNKHEPHECRATGHVLRHLNEHPHINPTIDCPKVTTIDDCTLRVTKMLDRERIFHAIVDFRTKNKIVDALDCDNLADAIIEAITKGE